MPGKKVTVIVFGEAQDRIKTYRIPKSLPWLGLLASLLVIAGLLTFSIQTHKKYEQVKGYQTEALRLRQKAAQQDIQIYAFADKIRSLDREMDRLRQFDRQLRAASGKSPVLGDVSNVSLGGSDSSVTEPQANIRSDVKTMVRQMHRSLDRLLAEAGTEELSQQELANFLEDTKSIVASTPTDWPLKGKISSYFGYRKSPFGGSSEFHRGLDICAPHGTPIVCPADGIVVETEWNSGYGLILSINHGYGVVTRYAHLSEAFVKPGQRVTRGQKIAAVGSSGRVTGPHLHYEAIVNGVPVNPMRYLTADKN